MTWIRNLRLDMGSRNIIVRCLLAEFLGTFVAVALGTSGIAQHVYSESYSASMGAVSYGLGYMMGMFVAMGITGGHLNPCITLVSVIEQKIHLMHAFGYIVAQLLGAFLANACVYGVYKDALERVEPGDHVVPGYDAIFTSYSHPDVGVWIGFADQIMAASLLVITYLAVTDNENGAPPHGLRPFFIGLSYIALGLGFSFNTTPGPSCNPARDFAGRVFVSMAGWHKYPFTINDNNWFWIPIIAPLLGAIVGLILYQLFVALHEPLSQEEVSMAEEERMHRRMPQNMPGGATYGAPYGKPSSGGDFGPNFPGRRF